MEPCSQNIESLNSPKTVNRYEEESRKNMSNKRRKSIDNINVPIDTKIKKVENTKPNELLREMSIDPVRQQHLFLLTLCRNSPSTVTCLTKDKDLSEIVLCFERVQGSRSFCSLFNINYLQKNDKLSEITVRDLSGSHFNLINYYNVYRELHKKLRMQK